MQRFADLFHLFGSPIFLPRPEESFQAIAFRSGNHMDVKMGDALANAVVDGNESSLRIQPFLHRNCQQSCVTGKKRESLWRDIDQAFEMLTRDQQTVAGK